MNLNNTIKLVLILLFFSSCTDKEDYYQFFKGEYSGSKNLIIEKLALEEINLGSNENCSFEGSFLVKDSNLIFLDRRFCSAYVYDKNGKFVRTALGQGRGPLELSAGRLEFCTLFKNKFVFWGGGLDVHIHDSDWNRISTNNNNYLTNKNEFNPALMDPYTPHYFNFYSRINSKDEMFIPIYSECDKMGILSGENYYLNGRILMKYDLNAATYKGVEGRISPEYYKRLPNILPYHLYYDFDIDKKDNFLVSYEIDSLIYRYDSDYHLTNIFGAAGSGMDTSYKTITLPVNKNRNPDLFIATRQTKGYYTHIEYFDEYDLLFRSYTKGGDSQVDGLQIYKGNVLVGDIEVPKGLKWVKGCIPPYFYSNVLVDDEELSMKIYRFKLPESILK